jgi:uncharacterized repeat protein (TIGR03803 family)
LKKGNGEVSTLDACGKYVLAGALAALASFGTAYAGVTVLHAFTGGSDGAYPEAGLIFDSAGNLFGTTEEGGKTGCVIGSGCGTVFKIALDGTETVFYAFAGGSDGGDPIANLIKDKVGNLYGTTAAGGGGACSGGCGTVFTLAPDGTEAVLYAFGSNAAVPAAGLIKDEPGDLFGTTVYGGLYGKGTVFELAANGTETVRYSFRREYGESPVAGLIKDKAGNLYGTAGGGGHRHYGIVFELAADGTETVLHDFTGGSDGLSPVAQLIKDKAGNLYGTTAGGGGGPCFDGCGTVFKLAPDGTETVLHAFAGGSDGAEPVAQLIKDKAGNLYGTTEEGGSTGCGSGCGTVFKLAANGTETVLYAFTGGSDGAHPEASLIKDSMGNLYGTTTFGGDTGCENGPGCGTVFKLKK